MIPTSLRTLAAVALALTVSTGCNNTAGIDVQVGPFAFDVDTGRIALPTVFLQGSTVARVPCQMPSQCPGLGAGGPVLRCTASVCTPDPFQFDLALPNVIDVTSYSTDLGSFGNHITQIDVTRLMWNATATGLTVPVGPVVLSWGPEAATSSTSDGVQVLGTLGTLHFAPDGTASGEVQTLPAGSNALSSYLLHTSMRFRVFARPSVTLTPGGPIPSGHVALTLTLGLHVEGELIR